jgi:polysaccharide biosynthesis transport protein
MNNTVPSTQQVNLLPELDLPVEAQFETPTPSEPRPSQPTAQSESLGMVLPPTHFTQEALTPIATQSYFRSKEKKPLDFNDILTIVRRRWLLMTAIAGTAFAGTAAWTFTRTPIYATSFQILVRQVNFEATRTLNNPEQGVPNEGMVSSVAGNYSTLIQILQTPPALEPALQKLQERFPDLDMETLLRNLIIVQLKDTDILSVSYTDSDPAKAQAIARQIADAYTSYGDSLRKDSLTQGISFVSGQLPELQARVQSLQVQLRNFRQRYTLVDPDVRANGLTEQLNGLKQRREESRTALAETRAKYQNLRQQLGNTAPTEAISASALSASVAYQALLSRLQDAEVKIAQGAVIYQPDSPQMKDLLEARANLLPLLNQESRRLLGNRPTPRNQGNIAGVARELNDELVRTANSLQILQVRDQALTTAETNLRQEFELYPDLSRQYTDLQRQLKIATSSLERFLATRETLEIEAAQKSQPWRLTVPPGIPAFPISPNIPRNLILGFLGSVFLGTSAALLAEKFKDVFHSVDELKNSITLPLLAVVPYRPQIPTKQKKAAATLDKIEQGYSANSFIDSFRSLYSSLCLLRAGTPIKSVVVSSAIPSEGKSTSAYNLALSAAAMGKRVLLVDADMRRPTIHQQANIPNVQGLSNVIIANVPLKDVVQRSSLEENLYILTSGTLPPDPTRILSSSVMGKMMKQLEEVFDLIVYDAPPLLGFADSLLLSSKTDGCVIIVGLGYAERSAVRDTLEQLQTAKTPVLGVVANCRASYTQQGSIHRYYYNYHASQTLRGA